MPRLWPRTALTTLALTAGAVVLQTTAAYAATDMGWFPAGPSACEAYGQALVDTGEYDSYTCRLVSDGGEWRLYVD
ncbi:hypothetical protein ABZW30_45780 [Kitasatospora sp. NPDC004669]|uniref:hypothetical protein n=1 Tax=Kitasatospora sp. NPDC004669 TaxID=3154555 RepID=UPI0033A23FD0